MLPMLELAADGKEYNLTEAADLLCARLEITDEQRKIQVSTGTQPVVNNRIGWARTYLTKAGLLETPGRSLFKITKRGLSVLEEGHRKIDLPFLDRYPEFARFRNPAKKTKRRPAPKVTGPGEVSISIIGRRATLTFDANRLPKVLVALGIKVPGAEKKLRGAVNELTLF